MRDPVITIWFGFGCPKRRLKTLQQSDMRAQRAWIRGSTVEILSILHTRKMTGEQLKNLRKTLGLTQKDLAEILGVTPLTIIRSERSGPSRMVQSFIDRALRAGDLGLPRVSEPVAEYGKKVPRKPTKRPPKKAP
jgi:DNA-binding transcriptional regulator YiaG